MASFDEIDELNAFEWRFASVIYTSISLNIWVVNEQAWICFVLYL